MHFFQVRAYLMLLRVWQFELARGVALDLATFVLSLLYFTTRIVMVPCAVPEKGARTLPGGLLAMASLIRFVCFMRCLN